LKQLKHIGAIPTFFFILKVLADTN